MVDAEVKIEAEGILTALERIPLFEKLPPPYGLRVWRLGGLTNRNYKIVMDDEAYVLRIPGEKTGDYINRAVEATNAKAAAAAGVNAEVVFFDAEDGLMLAALPRAASPCRRNCSRPVPGPRPGPPGAAPDAPLRPALRLPLRAVQMMDDYLKLLAKRAPSCPRAMTTWRTRRGRCARHSTTIPWR